MKNSNIMYYYNVRVNTVDILESIQIFKGIWNKSAMAKPNRLDGQLKKKGHVVGQFFKRFCQNSDISETVKGPH
jgi:hypothetical protein